MFEAFALFWGMFCWTDYFCLLVKNSMVLALFFATSFYLCLFLVGLPPPLKLKPIFPFWDIVSICFLPPPYLCLLSRPTLSALSAPLFLFSRLLLFPAFSLLITAFFPISLIMFLPPYPTKCLCLAMLSLLRLLLLSTSPFPLFSMPDFPFSACSIYSIVSPR